MANVPQLLKRYSGVWKEAEVRRGRTFPDGRYQVKMFQLEGRALVVQDRDQAIRLRVGLEIVAAEDEDCVGGKTTKSFNLFMPDGEPNEVGLSILKSELARLDVDVEELTLEQMPEAFEELLGVVIDTTFATKEGSDGVSRQNIYLNALAEGGAAKPTAKGKGAKKGAKKGRKY